MVTTIHPIKPTQFESLNNELLLNIFEYLDAYRMCQAFYGLNFRINSILQLAQLYISFDLSTVAQNIWKTVTLFPRFSQIRSLSLFDTTKINEDILISTMMNLRTVLFHSVNLKSIDQICHHISPDNQIQCLSVIEKPTEWYDGTGLFLANLLLVNHSHRFLLLTHLSLSSPWCRKFPVIFIILHQLRYLSLTNFCFSVDLLQFLNNNTPNLQALKFLGMFCPIKSSSITIKHIYELHINNQNDLSQLEDLLSKFPSLCRLHIEYQYRQRHTIFNGSLYQQLIEQYCPDLRQLTMNFNLDVNEEILSTFYQDGFWSTKLMKMMSIDPTQPQYSLIKTISFGKEWRFSYFDNLHHV